MTSGEGTSHEGQELTGRTGEPDAVEAAADTEAVDSAHGADSGEDTGSTETTGVGEQDETGSAADADDTSAEADSGSEDEAEAEEADPVEELLASVTDDDLGFFPHIRHRVPRVWGGRRTTLIGDAVHAMPPAVAQAANQTLEDAWLLSHLLGRAEGDPE